jgi:hypothetical protein
MTKRLASFSSLSLVIAGAALAAHGCSSSGGSSSAECSSLDATERAQASLLAYADATALLRDRALEVEGQFLTVCNAINRDLGLETGATAAEACSVLRGRVLRAFDAGATVEAQVGFNCDVDIQAQADCEALCQVQAACDLQASCTGGELLVECNGVCSAECDVTAPEFACQGSCRGTCTADVAAECNGECQGRCTAPRFEGTCDVGCTLDFTGSCLGE